VYIIKNQFFEFYKVKMVHYIALYADFNKSTRMGSESKIKISRSVDLKCKYILRFCIYKEGKYFFYAVIFCHKWIALGRLFYIINTKTNLILNLCEKQIHKKQILFDNQYTKLLSDVSMGCDR